ncbi:MAG: helix-turn-helix transcriptional regulator [Rickettsia endosymbiont of Glossina mortisans submortisans]|nr:helix-turn-helix transcriptional regulator [Rickettsia endosymbiont of Glossina mortisans submortisans]
MSIITQLESFLQERFKNDKTLKKELILNAKISAPTISKILSKKYRNPRLPVILKLADYFKCSIDEVLGRENFINDNKNINFVSLEKVTFNLRKYIQNKIDKLKLNKYQLGIDLGFNEHIIFDFIKDESNQKTLGAAAIIALADYFEVSIDEMIGRVSPSNQESQQTTEIKSPLKNQ